MAFRDDREAMRARLEATESELQRAQRELSALRGGRTACAMASSGRASLSRVMLVSLGAVVMMGGLGGVLSARARAVPRASFAAVARGAEVTAAQGMAGVAAGSRCGVSVTPSPQGDYNCRVQVRCGGRLVYGEGSYGYMTCEVRDGRALRGADTRPTSEDGDGAVVVDLVQGTLHLWDDRNGQQSLDLRMSAP